MTGKLVVSTNSASGNNVVSSMATPSAANQMCNESGKPSKRKSASTLLSGKKCSFFLGLQN